MQNNLGCTDSITSPILPCICQSRKSANLSTLTPLLLQGQASNLLTESVLLVVPYRMDWLDTCKRVSGILLAATLQGHADITLLTYSERAEQMEHHPERILDPVITESLLQLTRSLSERRGCCQLGRCCAGIHERYLLADQALLETPQTSVTKPTQTMGCWISQTGSGSFS